MTTVSNTMLQMTPYNQQIVELKKCNSSYQISLEMILFNSYLFNEFVCNWAFFGMSRPD
jgi:hypothetical protein